MYLPFFSFSDQAESQWHLEKKYNSAKNVSSIHHIQQLKKKIFHVLSCIHPERSDHFVPGPNHSKTNSYVQYGFKTPQTLISLSMGSSVDIFSSKFVPGCSRRSQGPETEGFRGVKPLILFDRTFAHTAFGSVKNWKSSKSNPDMV